MNSDVNFYNFKGAHFPALYAMLSEVYCRMVLSDDDDQFYEALCFIFDVNVVKYEVTS